MVTVWWSAIGVDHYSFLESNQSITAEVYCQQLNEIHVQSCKMQLALVRQGSISLHDCLVICQYDCRNSLICDMRLCPFQHILLISHRLPFFQVPGHFFH